MPNIVFVVVAFIINKPLFLGTFNQRKIKIIEMKPYLNLALLSKDWLDHGRDSRSQSRASRRLYQPFISSKVGNALMQMTFSSPPLRRIFKTIFFSKMLLRSVTERSLSVSFRSMLQCVCVRSKRRINNVCSSFFVLCSKIWTRVVVH